MEFLTELWMPILLSAFVVFALSAMAWTVLPHHHKEYAQLPNEDAVAAAIRAGNVAPGTYSIPHSGDMKTMGTPEMKAKLERGPRAFVTIVRAGNTGMGPMMVSSFVSNVVISIFVAYIASNALAPDAEYLSVFRIVATIGFMAYAFGSIPDSVWFGKPWKSWMLQATDSLVYGLAMGGVFGWLWS